MTSITDQVRDLLATAPAGMTAAELAHVLGAPVDAVEAALRAGPFRPCGRRRRPAAYLWAVSA